jgi:hypothetical protein
MTAQVVTITESHNLGSAISKIKWAWKTDSANGAIVDATAAGEKNKTDEKYTGQVIRLITDPVDGPTDNYDLAINDDDAMDVTMGAGQNRHTTTTQQVLASSLGYVYDSYLSLTIGTAGNSKSGIAYLYILRQ